MLTGKLENVKIAMVFYGNTLIAYSCFFSNLCIWIHISSGCLDSKVFNAERRKIHGSQNGKFSVSNILMSILVMFLFSKPLVNEAKLAVGNIKPESLSEIRSLRMPPDIIRDILEGVLRLMGIFDTSWVSMKRWGFYFRSDLKTIIYDMKCFLLSSGMMCVQNSLVSYGNNF